MWAAACRQHKTCAKVGLGNAQTFTSMLSVITPEKCAATILLRYCKHTEHRYEEYQMLLITNCIH